MKWVNILGNKNKRLAQTNEGLLETIKKYEYGDSMVYPISEIKPMYIPTYDNANQPCHPSVVFIPQGFAGFRWWMAMTPHTDGDAQVEDPSVLASDDGETWVVPPNITNPIEPSPAGAAYNRDAEIVWVDDKKELRVYWGNSNGEGYYIPINNTGNLGAKVVVNGVFDTNQATIAYINKKFVAWSTTNVGKSKESPYNFPMYHSDDGVNFTMTLGECRTNMFSPIWHQGITYDAAGFHAIGSFFESGKDRDGMELHYGYSADGQNWTYDTSSIVARSKDKSSNHSWYVYKSHICPMGSGVYRIFISGRSVEGHWGFDYVDVKTNNPGLKHSLVSNNLPPRTVTLFKNIELRDANPYYFANSRMSIPEFSMYKNKMISVYNSHDKEITLRFFSTVGEPNTFRPSVIDGVPTDFAMPTNTARDQHFTKDTIPVLGTSFPASSTVSVVSLGGAPTTGKITVLMHCWN